MPRHRTKKNQWPKIAELIVKEVPSYTTGTYNGTVISSRDLAKKVGVKSPRLIETLCVAITSYCVGAYYQALKEAYEQASNKIDISEAKAWESVPVLNVIEAEDRVEKYIQSMPLEFYLRYYAKNNS